jgi:hypothetical protein
VVAPVSLPPPPVWMTLAAASATNGQRNGKLEPASPETRDKFRDLMAEVGVHTRGRVQELVPCPWHNDTHASLSVNWEAAVFCCQGCDTKGGWRRLRELVGEPDLRRLGRHADELSTSANGRHPPKPPQIDAEREKLRLAGAMKQAGLSDFNRSTGRALYETVIECHTAFSKYECPADGKRKVLASSCGFRLCPSCLPTRLRADFNRHRANLPDRVSLYVWKPAYQVSTRRNVSDAFKRWRREQELTAGFYGVRAKVANGISQFDVLLVLPAGVTVTNDTVTTVAENVDLVDAIQWYVDMFLEEATSWRTPDELLDLLAAVKGCRRFQGFGEHYGRSERVDEKHLSSDSVEETPKKLGKVSGGSGKGGGREPVLCECGARMRFVGTALNREEAESWVRGGRAYLSDYKCSEAAL